MFNVKNNKSKRILSIFSLVFLIVAVVAALVLVRQNQDIREDAAGGCKFIDDAKECRTSCGLPKNGKQYKCKMIKGKCAESGKLCGESGYESLRFCPNGSSCSIEELKYSHKCKSPDHDIIWNCCPLGLTFADDDKGCVIPLP
jgi:hypothetical protein